MNIEVLKRQLGSDILNSLDDFKEGWNGEGKDMAILINEGRTAKIMLNAMDLYDIILKGKNQDQEIKENVYGDKLKEIINDHFNFSLKQALDNEDEQREQEIKQEIENGKKVRIL